MSNIPESTLLLTMGGSMAAVVQAANSKDTKAGVSALNACWEAAKLYFAGDRESRDSFRQRLETVRDYLQAAKYEDASELAEFVRGQMGSLTAVAALSEDVRRTAAEMTKFDRYVGLLCQQTYQNRGSAVHTLMYGMLDILEHGMDGDLAEGESPRSLLEEKAKQSAVAEEEINFCRLVVQLTSSAWSELQERAKKNRVPLLVELLTFWVESAEQRYPRPQGSIPPGHYAVVANFVFAIGLHFADMQQSLATQLVKERQSSPSA